MRIRGYAKIENEILEALAKSDLCSYEFKVVMAILRKTYGWDKDFDRIPGSQIVKMTEIKKSNVSRTIKRLIKKGVITKKGNKLGIERDFSKWKKLSLQITIEKVISTEQKVISTDNKKLSLQRPSIERTNRNSQQKGNFKSKLSEKEKQELQDKKELKEDMLEKGYFDKDFIDELISKHTFRRVYDAWEEEKYAYGVRDPKAWLLAKLG